MTPISSVIRLYLPMATIHQLNELQRRDRLSILGLMTGTSADGLDWCQVQFDGHGRYPNYEVMDSGTIPYPEELARAFRNPLRLSTEQVAELHAGYGRWLADVLEEQVQNMDLVGSHGQTLAHQPPDYTLQIGDPGPLVQRYGIPVIYNFRIADLNAGGQGAPLIPIADDLIFQDRQDWTMAINIGGIANFTVLPPLGSRHAILAWDCGPGNMLIDRAVREYSSGGQQFDKDGELAAEGRVDEAQLKALLETPYFSKLPPKSAGQEDFGEEFYATHFGKASAGRVAWADLVQTLTRFTAEAVYQEYHKHGPGQALERILISGGGAKNLTLLKHLKELFPGSRVQVFEQSKLNEDNKEAFGFAYLAWLRIKEIPGNLPEVTGATGPRILGRIQF